MRVRCVGAAREKSVLNFSLVKNRTDLKGNHNRSSAKPFLSS